MKVDIWFLFHLDFGPFDNTGTRKEIKEIEEVETDEAEKEEKEKSINAGRSSYDDIHCGLIGLSSGKSVDNMIVALKYNYTILVVSNILMTAVWHNMQFKLFIPKPFQQRVGKKPSLKMVKQKQYKSKIEFVDYAHPLEK